MKSPRTKVERVLVFAFAQLECCQVHKGQSIQDLLRKKKGQVMWGGVMGPCVWHSKQPTANMKPMPDMHVYVDMGHSHHSTNTHCIMPPARHTLQGSQNKTLG